jgi:hypothetical protein
VHKLDQLINRLDCVVVGGDAELKAYRKRVVATINQSLEENKLPIDDAAPTQTQRVLQMPDQADGDLSQSREDTADGEEAEEEEGEETKEDTQQMAEPELDLCVICMDNPKEGAFLPCGHRSCCMECGQNMVCLGNPCPICRKEPKVFLRIYTWSSIFPTTHRALLRCALANAGGWVVASRFNKPGLACVRACVHAPFDLPPIA